jgi:RecJ-like exonuclease
MSDLLDECPRCEGAGYFLDDDEDPCQRCGGRGMVASLHGDTGTKNGDNQRVTHSHAGTHHHERWWSTQTQAGFTARRVAASTISRCSRCGKTCSTIWTLSTSTADNANGLRASCVARSPLMFPPRQETTSARRVEQQELTIAATT